LLEFTTNGKKIKPHAIQVRLNYIILVDMPNVERKFLWADTLQEKKWMIY